jgi:hypothetical protein
MNAHIQCIDGIKRVFVYRKNKNGDLYICKNCSLFVFAAKDLEYHTCKLSNKYLRRKGFDAWGGFYNLSGHEENGHCFWCGTAIKGKRRYCSKQHAHLYLTFFHWREACINVYHRIYDPIRKGQICEKCEEVCGGEYSIEVHHIIPLNGEDRLWNVKNHPENLLGLCKECHKEIHRLLFEVKAIQKEQIKEQNRLNLQKQLLEIQLELFTFLDYPPKPQSQ